MRSQRLSAKSPSGPSLLFGACGSTAPAAASIAGTAIEGSANDTIAVTSNDDLIESEVETLANWTVEAPMGTAFDVTGATVDDNAALRTATITLGAGSTDQNLQTFDDIHATFTTMRDLGGNVVTTTNIATTAVTSTVGGDTTPPTLLAAAPGAGNTAVLTFSENVAGVAGSGRHTITVTFDEPWSPNSAVTPGNYSARILGGTAISLTGAAFTAYSTSNEVEIMLAEGTYITIGDAILGESMDFSAAMLIGNWAGSNGQNATSVMMLNAWTYRVTFDAAIAPADTIDASNQSDVAGNAVAGVITITPVE